jgi:hypothetical protein
MSRAVQYSTVEYRYTYRYRYRYGYQCLGKTFNHCVHFGLSRIGEGTALKMKAADFSEPLE